MSDYRRHDIRQVTEISRCGLNSSMLPVKVSYDFKLMNSRAAGISSFFLATIYSIKFDPSTLRVAYGCAPKRFSHQQQSTFLRANLLSQVI